MRPEVDTAPGLGPVGAPEADAESWTELVAGWQLAMGLSLGLLREMT